MSDDLGHKYTHVVPALPWKEENVPEDAHHHTWVLRDRLGEIDAICTQKDCKARLDWVKIEVYLNRWQERQDIEDETWARIKANNQPMIP